MQIPYRKPGKFALQKPDSMMTGRKLNELKNKLDRLKSARPAAAAEVARLAELGDFSENAEYQLAKGKLRGMNNAMLKLEYEINNATIIDTPNGETVEIGGTVQVECEGIRRTYHILGSAETDPAKGIISYSSPLGSQLLHAHLGDTVSVTIAGQTKLYKILSIE